MKKVIIILLVSVFMSCSKEDDSIPCSCFINKNIVEFTISNAGGEDLLNPSTPDAFLSEEMRLYYLIGGEKVLAKDFDPELGGEGGIMLITETAPCRLKVFTYSHEDESLISEQNDLKKGISTAFLELGKEVTDTIKVEWESKKDMYVVNKKVWYNGKLHEPAEKVFEVVKSL